MRLLMTCALAATAIASASSAQAAELKVAYMPCGNVNDKSWSENGYLGLQDAQKTLASSGTTMKLDYTESQPASDRRVLKIFCAITIQISGQLVQGIVSRIDRPQHPVK